MVLHRFTLSLEGPPDRAPKSRAPRLLPSYPLTSAKPAAYQCPLLALCFQQLPTVKFSNHFVLITIQNAPRVCTPSHGFQSVPAVSSQQLPLSLFHQSLVTNHQSLSPVECAVPPFRALTPLECAVEHPMKDASPEGVSRPKDLSNVSASECALTQDATLTPLECAVTKTRLRNPFKMRSSKKRGGRVHSYSAFYTRTPCLGTSRSPNARARNLSLPRVTEHGSRATPPRSPLVYPELRGATSLRRA